MTTLISPDEAQTARDGSVQAGADSVVDRLEPVGSFEPWEPARRFVDPWARLSALILLGGISGVAYYLGFVHPYLLSEYYASPLLDLAKISGYTAPSANLWGITWMVVLACYYLAFRLCPPGVGVSRAFRRVALLLICGWAAFFAINLIFMYPVGAADLFDQIFRARLTAHYGYNPFVTLPLNLPGDPFQRYVAWQGDPSPYGPMWEALAAGTSLLGGDSLWNNLILFKVLVVLAYAASVGLTYAILRSWKPDWALRGTLFFAWNPLVLFEVAGNGHNDAIVIMFMLAGVLALVLARRWAILPALIAGALTKFVPILLVPVALAAIWRDRLRRVSGEWAVGQDFRQRPGSGQSSPAHTPASADRPLTQRNVWITLAVSAALILGMGLVLYGLLPFWTGLGGILPRNRGNLFTASIPKVIVDALVRAGTFDETSAQYYVRNTAYGLVGLIALGLAIYVLWSRNATTPEGREKLVDRTLIAFYEIIFAYLAIASLWFQPWYLMWLVALTAPLARPSYVNRTLLFCIGGIANYFVWDYIWLWNRTDIGTLQITSALAIYTLPLLYTFYTWLRPRFYKL
jgi:hypothetical protein